jgi:hypothetical protein
VLKVEKSIAKQGIEELVKDLSARTIEVRLANKLGA